VTILFHGSVQIPRSGDHPFCVGRIGAAEALDARFSDAGTRLLASWHALRRERPDRKIRRYQRRLRRGPRRPRRAGWPAASLPRRIEFPVLFSLC